MKAQKYAFQLALTMEFVYDMLAFLDHYFFERLGEWRESTCAVLTFAFLLLPVTAGTGRAGSCCAVG